MKCYCVVLLTMWPWPLTFELLGIVARGVGNLPTNFAVSRTFRSRLIGQHLSDGSRDLATLTLTLEVTALRWYGSSCSVCVPSFVGLPVRKILGIYCVSINPPGDWPLTFEPQNRFTASILPILGFLGLSVLELGRSTQHTDRQTDR